jgi:ABC-type multidrug transport system ATPase subunit
MVKVESLVKIYRDLTAVDGLSFDVAPGGILGLVGPNGAGKTTTLRCLAGILPPTSGRLQIAGFDLEASPVEAKRRLAFMPDEPHLFEYLTVEEHLRLMARLYGVDAEVLFPPQRTIGHFRLATLGSWAIASASSSRAHSCAIAIMFGSDKVSASNL